MEKKDYKKPTTRVVEIQQIHILLPGSQDPGSGTGY